MAREDISENCKLSSGYRIRQLLNILQIKLSCIISFYITIIEIRNANQSFSALMKTIRALFLPRFLQPHLALPTSHLGRVKQRGGNGNKYFSFQKRTAVNKEYNHNFILALQ